MRSLLDDHPQASQRYPVPRRVAPKRRRATAQRATGRQVQRCSSALGQSGLVGQVHRVMVTPVAVRSRSHVRACEYGRLLLALGKALNDSVDDLSNDGSGWRESRRFATIGLGVGDEEQLGELYLQVIHRSGFNIGEV